MDERILFMDTIDLVKLVRETTTNKYETQHLEIKAAHTDIRV